MGAIYPEDWQNFIDKFGEVKNKVFPLPATFSWDGYPELLMAMGWDIGIAPLIDDEFNRCKSHIKWMEYSMKRIPTVASRVYPYSEPIDGVDTIKDGETGFLCENQKEWIDKLSYLIENKKARKEMGYRAYNFIKKKWQWKDWIYKWENAIESLT
jgi:glycosyltransferase involved in cell wall biosynthesis